MDPFGAFGDGSRPPASGGVRDRALQRHDVLVGVNADVAVLQQVLIYIYIYGAQGASDLDQKFAQPYKGLIDAPWSSTRRSAITTARRTASNRCAARCSPHGRTPR